MIFPSSQAELPTVTIAIPTLNEAENIKKVIQCFLSTNYPYLIEIFVADSGSTDETLEIVKRLSNEDARVKLLPHLLKVQSAGLNLILQHASGEVFLRADAHSDYSSDYIEQCVKALLDSQALNVGGAQRFVAKTPFQAGIALASKSFLGSGGAKYRNPNYTGYAETAYMGCFWKKVLVELSGYCVEATPNEDFELNLRLRDYYSNFFNQDANHDADSSSISPASVNKAIYISSKICAWYFPRSTWKALCKQYFKYGRGRYMTTVKHKDYVHWRGNLPFLVIVGLAVLISIDLLVPQWQLPVVELLPIFVLIPFFEGLRVTWKFNKVFGSEIWRGDKQKQPSFLKRWFFCSVTLLTIIIAHSLGFGYQLLKHQVLNETEF